MKNFKTIISVGGRFHAFYLAYQLEKRNHLQKLITSYPKFETVKYGIPRDKINSIIIKEILHRGWNKLPSFISNNYDADPFIDNIFDKLARNKIEETDLFVGWSSKSLYSLRKAKKLGAKIILERGSAHIEYQRDILKEEYNKFGVNFMVNHPKVVEKSLKEYEESDYISVPSSFAKRTFLNKGFSEDKLICIPYGVNLSEFKQVDKNDDVFRVVFAGGMRLHKGVHYLLKAFSELNFPNSELILLGSLNSDIKPFFEKYNVKQESEPGDGEGEILHLGHKPQNNLYKYYSQGSVYCHMSIQDGFGMVIPQAMACGLPIITTENTGASDLVEDNKNGFVIPIRDVNKLKEKLIYLYENQEKRKKMGQLAKEKVANGFSWDDYGNRTVNKYKELLNK